MSANKRANILVVDDVPDRLVAMQVLLEELDQNVVTVASGREALRQLLQDEFAVILLDVNMPDLDGFETAALIRQRPRSQHTPIIFVTAFGDEAHAFQGYSLGAVDYILTPVVPEILRAKVRVFVDLFHKNEQLKQQARRQAELVALADRRAAQLRTMAAELASTEHRERRRLAQVLHDHVQQLLVAAKMRAELARSEADRPATQQELRHVLDLLDQSITASRSLATDLCPPVLNEAGLAAGLDWLARWMDEKYNLQVDVHCELGMVTLADEMRMTLFTATRELLFNVVKHSGVTRARVAMRRQDDHWLAVVVEDSGSGFNPHLVQEEITPDGMGLFSIRERIETMGGRFEIHSDPGAGTRVTIAAPLVPAEGQADETARARAAGTASVLPVSRTPAAAEQAAARRIRVLLVDDHVIVRKGLRRLLQDKQEIEVVGEAADGCEAVAQAGTLAPDVIVMDVNMPRMNGIEATRHIKLADPGVEVIGLSLHEDQEVIASFTEAGASLYLTKDGPPEQLIHAILSVCRASAVA
jgi:DNA-binding NarL/FixJ family response regulator/anti-sigma regulatory factor (Ser/Thr protein kinase)